MNYNLLNQHQKFKKSAIQILASVTYILFLTNANSAEVEKKLLVTAGVVHESNPGYSAKNEQPVWTYTLAPQFQLGINDEDNRWFLGAGMKFERQSNEDVYNNRQDPNLMIGWDHTYGSGFFGIKAGYTETSSVAAQLRTTGEVRNIDSSQKTKDLAAEWQHVIDSRWSVLTGSAYSDVTYSNANVVDRISDYTVGSIGSKLTYATTEKLDNYVQLGYSQFRPDIIFDNSNLVNLLVGAIYQVNDGFSISSQVGGYNLSGYQSGSDWLGGVKADYVAERMTYAAAVKRDITPTSAGGFQGVDSLTLGWQFNFSERDKFGAGYSYYKYLKEADIFLSEEKAQQVGVFYERDLSSHWQTRVSLAHSQNDSSNPVNTNGTTKDDLIGVVLTYNSLNF